MNDEPNPWQVNAAALSIALAAMQSFAAGIVRHALGGGLLDQAALERLKAVALLDIKNADTSSFGLIEEPELLRQALKHFEQATKITIER